MVDNDINTAGIHGRKQGIPFRFHELRLHAEVLRDSLCHLHVEAHELAAFVMIAVRGIGSFRTDDQGSSFQNRIKQIGFPGIGRCCFRRILCRFFGSCFTRRRFLNAFRRCLCGLRLFAALAAG